MNINHTEIAKIIMGLAANFSAKIPEGLLETWHKAFLQDGYSIEQISAAAGRIMREKEDGYGRLPTYAEFIKAIGGGNRDRLAEKEALKIVELVRTEGAYSEPVLRLETKRVIDSRFGGWRNLCGSLEESKTQWFIRDFKEAYLSQEAETLMLPDKEESGRVLKQIEGMNGKI